MEALKFKSIDKITKLSISKVQRLKRLSRNLMTNEKESLFLLDGNIHGFHATYFCSDEFVGITVKMPKVFETSTLFESIGAILIASIGKLEPANKQKVILQLVTPKDSADSYVDDAHTNMFTRLINDERVKTELQANYVGISMPNNLFLFEQPYFDSRSKCSRYVKVDLNHPSMRTTEALLFFDRLRHDLTLCRGALHFVHGLDEFDFDPSESRLLYLMFRDRVTAEEWWKDLRNIKSICASVLARIELSSMYLSYICSRPGTSGAVASILDNIMEDAKTTYGLQSLTLIPANKTLEMVYKRPVYGFQNLTGKILIKYATPEAKAAAEFVSTS